MSVTDDTKTPSTMAGEVVGKVSLAALEEVAQILTEAAAPGTIYVVSRQEEDDE